MPFTPSHAVVALPFVRTPLVPAAVAVGAMTPDLPLFVRIPGLDAYGYTHDVGWLVLTVVIAFALLVLWRCVLRPAVRELSPSWLASRLPGEWDADARAAWRETLPLGRPGAAGRIALLVVALAIGVLSHIVWDLFTHEGRWGGEMLPILEQPWGPLDGVKWLQHGSSVIGLVFLAIAGAVWFSRRDRVDPARVLPDALRWVWWLSLPAVLVAAWVIGLAVFGPFTQEFTVAHLAYRVLPPACALWGSATVLLAVGVQILRARRAHASVAERPTEPSDRAGHEGS